MVGTRACHPIATRRHPRDNVDRHARVFDTTGKVPRESFDCRALAANYAAAGTTELALTFLGPSLAADMAYLGQIHSLQVPVEPDWRPQRMAEAFAERYRREFGNTLGDIPVVVVNARTTSTGMRHRAPPAAERAPAQGPVAPIERRPVHFGRWHAD